MNRIGHYLHAVSQYGLHSPFVYQLYTEVLFSRCAGRGRSAADVLWRIEHFYHAQPDGWRVATDDGLFLVVDHPHRDEAAWQSLIDDPSWQVTIDLFVSGIAVANPRLSKQHFLLR